MPAPNGASTEGGKGNHLQTGMAEPEVPKITVMSTSSLCSFSHSQLLHIAMEGEKHPEYWTPGSHKDGSALHERHGSQYTTVSYPNTGEN